MKSLALMSGLFLVLLTGCNQQGVSPPSAKVEKPGGTVGDVTIEGAGATFPFPIYSRWAYDYQAAAGVKINYQSIGSGGGIAQIKARTVDFGASDAPLTSAELDEAGLVQFPLVLGGVVLAVNVKGVDSGTLKLTRNALVGIYLGRVKKWNDPAIVGSNPGMALPDLDITVVHRADGSGTTWIFTNYLAKISPDWHSGPGCGKSISWPVGVGGKGNEGVAAYVQRLNGAIGYVEYAFAEQNKMAVTLLENAAGGFVSPSMESFEAAAANADWAKAPGFYLVLTDQPGDGTWPIAGASFILLHRDQKDAGRALQMLRFFDWCFKNGKDTARSLQYVPLPDGVARLVTERWKDEVKSSGKPIWE